MDDAGQELSAFRNRDNQILIVLSLVIGVIVGLTVVAFILLTGRLAARFGVAGVALAGFAATATPGERRGAVATLNGNDRS